MTQQWFDDYRAALLCDAWGNDISAKHVADLLAEKRKEIEPRPDMDLLPTPEEIAKRIDVCRLREQVWAEIAEAIREDRERRGV